MNRIILQANNKEELEKLIKRNIVLQKNETYIINEIKAPSSFLFFKFKGKYEINILHKEELAKRERAKEKAKKEELVQDKKENKKVKEKAKKEENKKAFNKVNEKKVEILDKKEDKQILIKEKIVKLLEIMDLDLELESIERKGNMFFVNLKGKDVKYIIGEKGIALNSLEYLFNSIKEFKYSKIILDANNYRAKRENSLLNLANKKAQKVIETKKQCKLAPMTSKERRIIHEEVSKYPELETESYGTDPKRYLVIKYVGNENE